MPLVYGQDQRLCDWMAQLHGYDCTDVTSASIGYERHGKIVAAILFENVRAPANAYAHVGATAEIFPGELINAAARYAFIQLGLRRLTFPIPSWNTKCQTFAAKLGAEREAVLKHADPDGDVFLYVLWRNSPFYNRLIATGRVAPLRSVA